MSLLSEETFICLKRGLFRFFSVFRAEDGWQCICNFLFFPLLYLQYPALEGYVLGEETASFTNQHGQTTDICIPPHHDAEAVTSTTDMLRPALGGDNQAAEALSAAIHCRIEAVDEERELEGVSGEVDVSQMGIWLDPIGKIELFFFSSSFIYFCEQYLFLIGSMEESFPSFSSYRLVDLCPPPPPPPPLSLSLSLYLSSLDLFSQAPFTAVLVRQLGKMAS